MTTTRIMKFANVAAERVEGLLSKEVGLNTADGGKLYWDTRGRRFFIGCRNICCLILWMVTGGDDRNTTIAYRAGVCTAWAASGVANAALDAISHRNSTTGRRDYSQTYELIVSLAVCAALIPFWMWLATI